ncbi:MAG: flavodoxin family protein [Peptostreptococcaceae bacterium]|nr:flavodoxin family protein [Peptostreptococcaceae bacterium]
MKNYKVVYFTRTGNSRRIAEKLGDKLACRVIEITDNMNWEGIWGFIKGGYYSSRNKVVTIKTSEEIADYDELIVVSPLWAGEIAPDTKELLKTVEKNKVHLIVVSNGSKIRDKSDYKSVNSIIKSKKNEDEVIDNLIDDLIKN